MKASELRVGNIIGATKHLLNHTTIPRPNTEDIIGSVHSIESNSNIITITDPEVTYCHKLKDCFGIPLTEEWLVKFGFKKYKETKHYKIESHNYSIYWDSYIATGEDNSMWRIYYHDTDYGNDRFLDCHQFVERLKYVHQIQNLYFALTGIELTIK